MWTEKYKPKKLDEVAGHAKLKKLIRKYIESGDIPNLLLHGVTPGTGKTLIAELIAREILGEAYDTNLIYCDASNDRSVGKIRPVTMSALRNATINGYLRILLFDEADGLISDAQDFLRGAMNKRGVVRFVFTCNDISRIKEPVQNRCMCFEFKPLRKEDITNRLKFICDSEQITIPDAELERIVKASKGSMRNAITELEKASMTDDSEEEILKRYLKK